MRSRWRAATCSLETAVVGERALAGPHPETAREVKAQLDAQRRGTPFLAYRAEAGELVTVPLAPEASPLSLGRRADNDVALEWDPEVSRVHAQLELVGHEWTVLDDGLSRNGTYVNGERVGGRRRLHDGARLCLGETALAFHAPKGGATSVVTAPVKTGHDAVPLSDTQRRV